MFTISKFRRLFVLLCGVAASLPLPGDTAPKSILFFGDSLTAGYGVDYEQAYPNLVQELIDADGLDYRVIPSGVSGETTAGGLRRIEWVLRQPIDLFVLALGGNDGLRGIDLKDTRANLVAIAEIVKRKNPSVTIVIAGMMMPPNLGETYTQAFKDVFPSVAEELGAERIPFLLEGVAGDRDLNLPDGIHPNPKGHRIVAQHVYDSIKPLLDGSK